MHDLVRIWFLHALVFVCLTIGSGCAFKPSLPNDVAEPFELEKDFSGLTVGQGTINAINGAHQEFTAYLTGTWNGKTLTLVEDFVYDDCRQERKTWRFTKLANGEWSGTRENVVGKARGFKDKKGFRLEYLMRIPNDDGTPGRRLRFKDVMYRNIDGGVTNNAVMGWYGLRVGKLKFLVTRPNKHSTSFSKTRFGPNAKGKTIDCADTKISYDTET